MKRPVATAIAISSLLLAADPAFAQTGERKFDTPPAWLRKPTPAELLAVWPRDPTSGRGGDATITCLITVNGSTLNCVVKSERPEGAGFGQAALALTPQLLFRPAMKDGKPVPAFVSIPINFEAAGNTGSHIAAVPNGKLMLGQVNWIAAPSYADVIAAYPAKAAASGLGGHATITCDFAKGGRLKTCQRVLEEPQSQGFAKAALALADKFVGPEKLADGRTTEGIGTTIAFTFDPSLLKGAPSVTRPAWTQLPQAEQLAALLPTTPTATRVETLLGCTVAADGSLADCRVEQVKPEGSGYGDVALRMAKLMRLSVWTSDGLPSVGGRINAPIIFDTVAPTAPEKPSP